MNQLTRIIGIAFTAFWIAFIFLEYWQFHNFQRDAWRLFQYGGTAGLLVVLGGVGTWAALRWRVVVARYINGLTITGLALVLMLIVMNAFFQKLTGTGIPGSGNVTLIGTMLGTALLVYLIMMVCYASGHMLAEIFGIRLQEAELDLVRIALGIMLVTFLLFAFGTVNLLQVFIVYPLFLLLLIPNWKRAWLFIQKTLLRPAGFSKDWNAVGVFSFYALLLLISMNFISVNRPFPFGFDSLTQYVNLASLVQDYGGLVRGNLPYNWSLFMSLGYLLFNQTAVVLAISFTGGILSLFALYHLSRKWLDPNFSVIVLLALYTMPMINWLSFKDMKVDMGLLFFTLTLVIVFYNWVAPPDLPQEVKPAPVSAQPARASTPKSTRSRKGNSKRPVKKTKAPTKPKAPAGPSWSERANQWLNAKMPTVLKDNGWIILMGIIAGFSAGIKLAALIALLALIAGIWYTKGGAVAFLGSFALVFAAVLVTGIDTTAGLRYFNQGATELQWTLIALALGVVVYLGVKKRAALFDILKLSVIVSVFFGLTISPWFIKNYSETGKLNVSSLTRGQTAHPKPNINEMDRIWKAQTGQN